MGPLVTDNSRKKLFLNIIMLIVASYGITKRDAAYQQTTPFENLMIDSFAPMQRSITALQSSLSSVFKNYVANVSASRENHDLKKQVSHLENELFSYQELAKENERLKDLLRFGKELTRKRVLAQIVGLDASSDFKVLRINKGLKDGIKLQSTVVTSNGLVGYVYRMTDYFSDIITILDSNNRVDGIIQRTRSHGIVEGFSGRTCQMKYVRRAEPIILNDLVLTSGLGNIYPKGLKVGRVTHIERESFGITQHVEITPTVDFDRLEEVVVLVAKEDEMRRKEWEILNNTVEGKEGKK